MNWCHVFCDEQTTYVSNSRHARKSFKDSLRDASTVKKKWVNGIGSVG